MTTKEKIARARELLEEARREIPDANSPADPAYDADFELGYALAHAEKAEKRIEARERQDRWLRDLL